MEEEYKMTFNTKERNVALKGLSQKITRILYVYEQSLINDTYHYKPYVYGVIMYVASINSLIDYDLTDVIVQLNMLLINKDHSNALTKKDIRKIVLDAKKIVEKLMTEE